MSVVGTGQAETLSSTRQQGTHTGRDVSVTGQGLQPPAVASRAGVNAAAMGANESAMQDVTGHDNLGGAPLEAAAQKALPAALSVMFKKHSVVNMQDIRYVGASEQHS